MRLKSRSKSKTRSRFQLGDVFKKHLLAFFSPWLHLDWFLLLLVVGLTIFGGLTILSTELYEQLDRGYQHWLIGGVGLAISLTIARCPYQVLLKWHWLTYALTNLSLIAVMVNGVTANGAQSWITIGGFNVQPSEFAKVGVIITLAALLHNKDTANLGAVIRTLAITAVPWTLIFLQPDLGTSLVFGVITIAMLYWANANPGWLLLLLSPLISAILYHVYLPAWIIFAIAMIAIAWLTLPMKLLSSLIALGINCAAVELGNIFWGLLKDYQKDRLILFLDPEKDPLGGGYHLIQSRIAIGAGGMWGQGFNHGTQTQLNFIPEQHTDFIFSAVGEEWGFIGSVLLLLVFWLICVRLVLIATRAKDNFGSLLAIGILAMIVFPVIVNISMTIGLAPITGIPLPWMSYGRSALLSNFIAIGLVQSVVNHASQKKRKDYFLG
ncbi:rod shape-determining protein RodA [Stanieria cyanosphaera PCC 7437]|uniref:Peptidoglycan glycosyltransferase RodA n=1 Tax=Stanieria cyanosphaera (strain ATCC 29371 / PCC 7437) TaxID=111780 RepID=K9XSP1_STAC7|nr:rod shape-determining protein RodA [Stanieria cyanosphaera]AFZ34697.1 rod shape-determining protein RodA [Stanieria cyanosphaera PCC 7437]